LDQVEYESLTRAQADYLDRIASSTRLTAEVICEMHKAWLGEIYDWAGQYRSVELEKGGFRWPPAFRVPENMARFERETLRERTPCQPDILEEVCTSIAVVHAELLLIHPFRDGNGRLARWIADLMANQAQLPTPDYALTGRGSKRRQEDYLEAVRRSYAGDYEDLVDFFFAALARRMS
jgi:cell filamentation protein